MTSRHAATLALSALLAWTGVCAAEESPAETATEEPLAPVLRPVSERSQEFEHTLQRRIPSEQQRLLETPNESFLALWQSAHRASPQGTLILLAGEGEHANHPAFAQFVRQQLPAAGWNTLSLSLPDSPNPLTASTPPSSTDTDEPNTEPSGATQTLPVEHVQSETAEQAPDQVSPSAPQPSAEQLFAQRIDARLTAALAFAQSQNSKEIILLGNSTGAYWAARFIAEQKPAAVKRLALVSLLQPQQRTSTQSLALPQHLPVLDLFYGFRQDQAKAAAARKVANLGPHNKNYKQLALGQTATEQARQEQLVRRLRGWLSPQQL